MIGQLGDPLCVAAVGLAPRHIVALWIDGAAIGTEHILIALREVGDGSGPLASLSRASLEAPSADLAAAAPEEQGR